jgi:NAD-dependent dihydropyrimidine dehydrogenase PreA subunit
MVEEMETEGPGIRIDRERCMGCFECVDICPQTNYTEFPVYEKGKDGVPVVVNGDSCIACLSCEASCRAEAITVEVEREKEGAVVAGTRAVLKCRAMF